MNLICAHLDGLKSTYHSEGIFGLYRGTSLALFGVSNGALQFMAYEKMKVWGFQQKRKAFIKAGKSWSSQDDKLVRLAMSPPSSESDIFPV